MPWQPLTNGQAVNDIMNKWSKALLWFKGHCIYKGDTTSGRSVLAATVCVVDVAAEILSIKL